MKQHEEYGVLIQGHTDQQGSAAYNKQLGLKRGETVKTELVQAGVAEHRMKVVSLGEEGALCNDDSDVCRYMNRRVHLEIRKIGQAHMILPATAADSSDSSDHRIDKANKMIEKADSLIENLVPLTPELIPGS
jgi:hypothetical protein